MPKQRYKRLLAGVLAALLLSSGSTASAASASDFRDVPRTSWYYDAVNFAVGQGLFQGTGAGQFSPSGTMTRGMFAVVLSRLAGAKTGGGGMCIVQASAWLRGTPSTSGKQLTLLYPGARMNITGFSNGWYAVTDGTHTGYLSQSVVHAYSSRFLDVSYGAYYRGAVDWASAVGIAQPTADEFFSPELAITRQDLCRMLYQLARNEGYTLPAGSTAPFSDQANISAACAEAVAVMHQLGVVQGRENGMFAPLSGATRAEVAAMLQRYCSAVEALTKDDASEPSGSAGQSGTDETSGNGTTTEPEPSVSYTYGTALPQTAAVTDRYFDDACFLGHSMVVGMRYYFHLDKAAFCAANGLSAAGFLSYTGFSLSGGGTGSLDEALGTRQFGKYYIMLGTNEITPDGSETYRENMRAIIRYLRARSPQAKIYLLSVLPAAKENTDVWQYLTPENIRPYNERLLELSAEEAVAYLDLWTLFADADGYLPAERATLDGIHPMASEYQTMKNALLTHTY